MKKIAAFERDRFICRTQEKTNSGEILCSTARTGIQSGLGVP